MCVTILAGGLLFAARPVDNFLVIYFYFYFFPMGLADGPVKIKHITGLYIIRGNIICVALLP